MNRFDLPAWRQAQTFIRGAGMRCSAGREAARFGKFYQSSGCCEPVAWRKHDEQREPIERKNDPCC